MKIPLALVILDGWGLAKEGRGNAITLASTPNMDLYKEKYPYTTLSACGQDVGLPKGQMGNSEVGHLNIGAGRIIYQELTRISKSIQDGEFFTNPVLIEIMEKALANKSALHLMGLLSDGGVHSHNTHLYALLLMAKNFGLKKVYLHCFMDGRDTPPSSGVSYIKELEDKLEELGVGKIATVIGRYYAMDRDKRWERVLQAYRAMVGGEGLKAKTALSAVQDSYRNEKTDEFILPTVIEDQEGNPIGKIKPNDEIIFFNFRPDRAREITRAFVDEDFDSFERPGGFLGVNYVCMTQYDKTIKAPVAFMPQKIEHTLGEVLAKNNLKQLRLAETEKYAHVTFFFNGGVETPNEKEDRILIPSPKVATYDLKPQMSALEVTKKALEQIEEDNYQVLIMNFANPDMLGHTGIIPAVVEAVTTVDKCLGQIVEAILNKDGVIVVTADHGNAEMMLDKNEAPITAHTLDPVPFLLIANNVERVVKLREGRLEDIAPTILDLLEIEKPKEMTGKSLIEKD